VPAAISINHAADSHRHADLAHAVAGEKTGLQGDMMPCAVNIEIEYALCTSAPILAHAIDKQLKMPPSPFLFAFKNIRGESLCVCPCKCDFRTKHVLPCLDTRAHLLEIFMIKEYKFLGWLTIEYSAANGFSFRLGAKGNMHNRRLAVAARPSAVSSAQQVEELSGQLPDSAGSTDTDGGNGAR